VSPLSILMFNQSWLSSELKALGHKVFSVSLTSNSVDFKFNEGGIELAEIADKLPEDFIPDRILYWDDSTVSWVLGLEEYNIPSLFYSVDAHQHHQWHGHFSSIFDKVLVAQKDYLYAFNKFSPNAQWLPLWATLEAPVEQTRDLEVSFVGNLDPQLHPKRAEFFRKIGEELPLTLGKGDYRETYARTKIVINQAVEKDLNFRVFEALSCGALLITERTNNGLLELFAENQDLVCYDTVEEAIEKAKFYLENPELRIAIARSGQEKVNREHSQVCRAKFFEAELLKLTKTLNPYRDYGASYSYMAGVVTCEGLKIPWGPKLIPKMRDNFLKLETIPLGEPTSVAILIAEYVARAASQEVALTFLERLKRKSPDNRALKLAAIQRLLYLERPDRALKLAAEISAEPEAVCGSINAELSKELSQPTL